MEMVVTLLQSNKSHVGCPERSIDLILDNFILIVLSNLVDGLLIYHTPYSYL